MLLSTFERGRLALEGGGRGRGQTMKFAEVLTILTFVAVGPFASAAVKSPHICDARDVNDCSSMLYWIASS